MINNIYSTSFAGIGRGRDPWGILDKYKRTKSGLIQLNLQNQSLMKSRIKNYLTNHIGGKSSESLSWQPIFLARAAAKLLPISS